MRVRIVIPALSAPPAVEGGLFTYCADVTPRRFERSLAISLAVHAALGCLMLVAGSSAPVTLRDRLGGMDYKIEPLRVVIPDRLHFRGVKDSALRDDRPRQSHGPTRVGRRELPAPNPVRKPDAHAGTMILQPQAVRIETTEDLRLPGVLAWSANRVELRRPSHAIVPGRTNAEPPHLAAKWLMPEPPNLESVAADINMAAVTEAFARLRLSAGASSPLRIAIAGAVPGPMQVGISGRDPSDLIVISNVPANSAAVHLVPAGSTIAREYESSPDDSSDAHDTLGSRPRVMHSDTGRILSTPASTNARPPNAPEDVGHLRAAYESASPDKLEGALESSGSFSAAILLPQASAPAELNKGPQSPGQRSAIEKAHPIDGTFDVVLIGSSSEDNGGPVPLLASKPVYTVFLDVGLPSSWTMQFCLAPSAAAVRQADDRIQPPYPIHTIAPEVARSTGDRTIIHAFLNSLGRFRDLTIVGSHPQTAAAALSLIAQWTFRPALLGNKPIEIELLLAIPGIFQ